MATFPSVSGGDSEVSINQANQWMRSQPWYQSFLAAYRQDPNAVLLTESQRQQLVRTAQANGMVIDEGAIEMDPSGNFNPRGHKMRNALIGLGVAGAAALTGGAALGAFGGAGAGAGAGGLSGLAGASYVVPSAALGAGGGIGGTAAALGAAGAAGAGGLTGLAPASYTVPSATLGAGGGMTGLATAGLAGSGYTVPSATLGANGGIPAGYGAGATGTSLAERMGRPLGRVAAATIPAVVGRALRGSGSGSGSGAGLPPELQQLLQMSLQRMSAQDPLFRSINAQAMAGLPTEYQRS